LALRGLLTSSRITKAPAAEKALVYLGREPGKIGAEKQKPDATNIGLRLKLLGWSG
jgi:hypothetical protein